MAWIRLEENHDEDPKFADLGDLMPIGHSVWVQGIGFCNRNLTDGLIPGAQVKKMMTADVAVLVDGAWQQVTAAMVARELVRVGLWMEEGRSFRIANYLKYQPSRDEVEEKKQQAVEVQRERGRVRAATAERDERGRFRREEDQPATSRRTSRPPADGPAGHQPTDQPDHQPPPAPIPIPVPYPETKSGAGPHAGGPAPAHEEPPVGSRSPSRPGDPIEFIAGRILGGPALEVFCRIWPRHPNQECPDAAAQEFRRQIPQGDLAALRRVEDVHGAWLASGRWAEKAPQLKFWLKDGGHRNPPEAFRAVGPPKHSGPGRGRGMSGDEIRAMAAIAREVDGDPRRSLDAGG